MCDQNDIPVLAIVDPDLMDAMPRSLKVATGLDALTHAIEAYITKDAWELTDAILLRAIQIIAANLKKAADGDPDAVEAMGTASYMAGIGFSNVGLGLVHGMAHPLSGRYNAPHGLANGILLASVMEYNADYTVRSTVTSPKPSAWRMLRHRHWRTLAAMLLLRYASWSSIWVIPPQSQRSEQLKMVWMPWRPMHLQTSTRLGMCRPTSVGISGDLRFPPLTLSILVAHFCLIGWYGWASKVASRLSGLICCLKNFIQRKTCNL